MHFWELALINMRGQLFISLLFWSDSYVNSQGPDMLIKLLISPSFALITLTTASLSKMLIQASC